MRLPIHGDENPSRSLVISRSESVSRVNGAISVVFDRGDRMIYADDDYFMETEGESALLEKMTQINNELINAQRDLAKKNCELLAALREVNTLRGLIPICAVCKNIRTDEQAWVQIEAYIQERADVRFSHGYCPKCEEACLEA